MIVATLTYVPATVVAPISTSYVSVLPSATFVSCQVIVFAAASKTPPSEMLDGVPKSSGRSSTTVSAGIGPCVTARVSV